MEIQVKIILLVVFVQVALTIWSIVSMGLSRVNALKTTDLHIRDIALTSSRYPDDVLKLGNNMQNQFETPILLYAGVAIAFALGTVNWVMTGAAVAYIVTRFWHRWIHIRGNNVTNRFKVFILGMATLTVFWIALMIQVFLS